MNKKPRKELIVVNIDHSKKSILHIRKRSSKRLFLFHSFARRFACSIYSIICNVMAFRSWNHNKDKSNRGSGKAPKHAKRRPLLFSSISFWNDDDWNVFRRGIASPTGSSCIVRAVLFKNDTFLSSDSCPS